jgi:hypothetical protein
MTNVCKIYVTKLEENIQLERPRSRLQDIIKINLEETMLVGVDCGHLAQDRFRWRAVMNIMKFRFHKRREIL